MDKKTEELSPAQQSAKRTSEIQANQKKERDERSKTREKTALSLEAEPFVSHFYNEYMAEIKEAENKGHNSCRIEIKYWSEYKREKVPDYQPLCVSTGCNNEHQATPELEKIAKKMAIEKLRNDGYRLEYYSWSTTMSIYDPPYEGGSWYTISWGENMPETAQGGYHYLK